MLWINLEWTIFSCVTRKCTLFNIQSTWLFALHPFLRHALKLLSLCSVFKARQYRTVCISSDREWKRWGTQFGSILDRSSTEAIFILRQIQGWGSSLLQKCHVDHARIQKGAGVRTSLKSQSYLRCLSNAGPGAMKSLKATCTESAFNIGPPSSLSGEVRMGCPLCKK